MLESKENMQNNNNDTNNDTNNDKFVSSFIMMMMVFFIAGSVFRKFYNDTPLFKIGWTKYSISDCRKYIAYIQDSSSFSKELKFQRNYYDVIKIAKEKSAITRFCKELGLKISSDDVKQSIKDDYIFSENNKFSRQKFLNFLSQIMISETEYYELKKEELLHQQFWFLLKNSYPLRDKFIKTFNFAYFANRTVKYAIVKHSDIKLKYTEKDLLNFYEKNKDKFRTYKRYTYEGFKIETSSFAQEDFTFLNRVIQNNNFESIIKNYPKYTTRITHDELINLFKNSLDYHADKANLENGNCFYLGNDGKFSYVVKIIDVKPEKQLSFQEVKDVVRKIYEFQEKPRNIDKGLIKWKKTSFNASDFHKSELPYRVAKKTFAFPLKKVREIHEDDVSYFIIVEDIVSVNGNQIEDYLKDFIDNEISFAVSKYLLSFVENV